MKKIFFFGMLLLLFSCGNNTVSPENIHTEKTEENISSSSVQTIIVEPDSSLTEGENEDLKKYLEDYEKTLRDDGGFSEETIQQALEIKKNEWIEKINNW